jgi:hypothetical protein
MSAEAVQAEIIEPMQRLYLPPRNMPEEMQSAALREYVKALEGFERTDLAVAWCAVRDVHATRAWPVPAVFITASRQARNSRITADARAPSTSKPVQTEWDIWKQVSRSPLAYEAVKNGVAWSLKSAILHDKKLPDQIDLRELISGKRRAELTAERIRRGQPHERKGRNIGVFSPGNAKAALDMWAAIQQRETETQNEIRSVA